MELKYDAAQPLDLEISLLMGQAFRWSQNGKWLSGVVRGQFIRVRQTSPGLLEFHSSPGPDEAVTNLLSDYLRLEEDVLSIYREISGRHRKIDELVAKYWGLRILRQEPWECLIAYCCSAPNSVRGITRLVERLATEYGEPLQLDGERRHTFPSPEQLAQADEKELRERKFGLHTPRILQVARAVSNGSLDLDRLKTRCLPEAKEILLSYSGISHKIASCVSLFSLNKMEAFPVDRHISEALVKYCFNDLSKTQLRTLERRGQEYFGPYAGYAGQFLFHHMRPVTLAGSS